MEVQTTLNAIIIALQIFSEIKEYFPPLRKWEIRKNVDYSIYEKQYIKSLIDNMNDIPEDNIQDPNFSIIYPAMNESLLYIKEEEIREMFAKMISSSFDKSKNEFLHPGFIGIIKQLSPVDARILLYINDTKQLNGISAIKDNVEYRLIETNLLKSSDDVESISLSIDNLSRLGLINVSRKSDIAFLSNEEDAITIDNAEPLSPESPMYTVLHHEYELYSVNAYMTVLGESFLKVCVD